MGAYRAGQPKAEGEPILLEMLRRGEGNLGMAIHRQNGLKRKLRTLAWKVQSS
jgi:hypothetical protein